MAIAFLLLAFLAIERRSPILAGVALGAGVLVKYFPVATGPALYKRWDWRLPVAFIATVAVLYLPYVGAGAKVLGFLGQYFAEEGIARGSGIFLWQLLGAIVPLPARAELKIQSKHRERRDENSLHGDPVNVRWSRNRCVGDPRYQCAAGTGSLCNSGYWRGD